MNCYSLKVSKKFGSWVLKGHSHLVWLDGIHWIDDWDMCSSNRSVDVVSLLVGKNCIDGRDHSTESACEKRYYGRLYMQTCMVLLMMIWGPPIMFWSSYYYHVKDPQAIDKVASCGSGYQKGMFSIGGFWYHVNSYTYIMLHVFFVAGGGRVPSLQNSSPSFNKVGEKSKTRELEKKKVITCISGLNCCEIRKKSMKIPPSSTKPRSRKAAQNLLTRQNAQTTFTWVSVTPMGFVIPWSGSKNIKKLTQTMNLKKKVGQRWIHPWRLTLNMSSWRFGGSDDFPFWLGDCVGSMLIFQTYQAATMCFMLFYQAAGHALKVRHWFFRETVVNLGGQTWRV